MARAEAFHIAADPEWHALLHYRPRPFGSGITSPVQSPAFFLSPDGRTDPRAELLATLQSFFDADASVRDGEHPQCAFIARYQWLKDVLHFDPVRLPEQPCPRFREWRAALDPAGMTLVFPEAYMNNPASMFGHTLLRVDMGAKGGERDLLAYAINFAAETGRDGGVAFAWKGILGYYPGFFSIQPYYDMVKTYGDWESRDIWEYELNLSAAQIGLILMHLWELRGVSFLYYFFDENCSYQLLSLLNVARPDLKWMDRFQAPWVIPVDTVRVVVEHAGLVGKVTFRPSAASELRHEAHQLSAREQRLAHALANGEVEPDDPEVQQLSDPARAAVLGVAYDYLRHRFLAHDVSRAESESRSRHILIARSRVDVTGRALPPVQAPPVRPDQGHRTARVALATGWRNDRFFLETRIRPAFHDLMDPQGGYTAGAQIDFLDLAVRIYPQEAEARLHELTVVDIVSLSPRDIFFRPISWKINAGLTSRLLPHAGSHDLLERHVWRTNGGAGVAFEPWRRGLAYAFVEATADAGPKLEDDYAIGPGLTAGLFFGPHSDRWKGHVFGHVTRFALGSRSTQSRVGGQQRLRLTAQTDVVLEASFNRDFGHSWSEGRLSWRFYF